jgi:hypothetical protein
VKMTLDADSCRFTGDPEVIQGRFCRPHASKSEITLLAAVWDD